MRKTILAVTLALACVAQAAPPWGAAKGQITREERDEERGERRDEMAKRMRMMMVVGLAETLGLNESEALRLSDKLKGLDEKRAPVRAQMHEAMKTLKAAADGDAAAQSQVDAAVQRILEGRQQMAVLDKEMFQVLSKDLSPQKRAQLALFLGRFQHEAMKMKGRHGGEGGKRFMELRGP